jgi:phospholipid/cholesterol/gamma-HCH transport system permease protein
MNAPVFARFGATGIDAVERFGRMGVFLARVLHRAISTRPHPGRCLALVHFIGARAVPLTVAAGVFVGMVVALQFHDTLVRFGSVSLLGAAVGLALIRELAPVLTALLVAGRAGSAMCAEIGIMRTEHQLDALECMAIDPLGFLMAPRLIAGLIAVPLLTALFVVVGIGGGWFMGVVVFGVSPGAYLRGKSDAVETRDLLMGFTKSLVFAVLIVWIASAKGYFLHLTVHGSHGAEGVSRVTTDAVVWAAIAILGADFLVSALFI